MNISPTNSVYYNQTKNERTDKMRSLSQEEIHRRKNITAAIIAAAALLAVTVPIFGKYLPQAAKDTSHSMAVLLYGNNTYSNINQTISESDNTVSGTRVYSYTSYSFDDSLMLSEGTPLMPSGSNEEKEITVPEIIAPTADDDEYTEKSGSIVSVFYGKYDGDDYISLENGGQVRNLTSLDNSYLTELSEQLPTLEIKADGEPEVLIMHTHTTECYENAEHDYYDENRSCRTLDAEYNMIAVGNMITEQLAAGGIGVIHDTTVHDSPSYNGSYDRSRETVKNILEQYPSVKIVLDIHRDAIERDGERIAPVTEINGKKAAQIMIICGCDDGTMNMPNCTENFKLACLMQSGFERDYPTLTRPVLFDYSHYNQDLTTGSLLIEVGGHANTLEQAKYSGELIGKSLAKTLKMSQTNANQ